jgi:hypothetical protein
VPPGPAPAAAARRACAPAAAARPGRCRDRGPPPAARAGRRRGRPPPASGPPARAEPGAWPASPPARPGSEGGGALEPRDDRMQSAAPVLGRAEPVQPLVPVAAERLPKRGDQTRLADASLAAQQHDLALAGPGAAPEFEQQLQLLITPDQRRRRAAGAQRHEAALDLALAQGAPRAHRVPEALQLGCPQVRPLEQRPREAPCRLVQHHRPGLGQALQPRREVGRPARHAPLARLAPAQRPRPPPPARWRCRPARRAARRRVASRATAAPRRGRRAPRARRRPRAPPASRSRRARRRPRYLAT